MKLRHTAALALLAWYLMMPSIGNPGQPTPSETPKPTTNTQLESQLVSTEERLADFTLLLVVVGVLQVLAASVQAYSAKLTLKISRPYLLVERVVFGVLPLMLDNEPPPSAELTVDNFLTVLLGAAVQLRNHGSGPALLTKFVVRMKPVEDIVIPKYFADCRQRDLEQEAVPPDCALWFRTDSGDGASISKAEAKAILSGEKTLLAYGRVSYEDVVRNRYETAFCWVCSQPQRANWGETRGRGYRGPKAHNRHT
jgi:hypothetical protein